MWQNVREPELKLLETIRWVMYRERSRALKGSRKNIMSEAEVIETRRFWYCE